MLSQTLKFSNGVKLTHSLASKNCEQYCKDVEKGKIVVEGLVAKFQYVDVPCTCKYCKKYSRAIQGNDCKKFILNQSAATNWDAKSAITIKGIQKNPVSTRKILTGS